MEWVETTGRTVADAVDAALDELGVDEQDAEIVIVSEARVGLFGLGRTEARVRARVRPATPRPKRSQRERSRSGRGVRASGGGRNRGVPTKRASGETTSELAQKPEPAAKTTGSSATQTTTARSRSRRRGGRGRKSPGGRPAGGGRSGEEDPMSVEEQVDVVTAFVSGVVERFGFEATTTTRVDEENLFVDVTGEDLGLLIGPRGATLDALQELARTVVHRHGDDQALRVIVDVAGFRQRRAAALETFTKRRAEEVLASGVAEALEPMSAADRKIVHDTVSAFPGLETSSEGIEPKRFVVIRPVSAASDGEKGPDD